MRLKYVSFSGSWNRHCLLTCTSLLTDLDTYEWWQPPTCELMFLGSLCRQWKSDWHRGPQLLLLNELSTPRDCSCTFLSVAAQHRAVCNPHCSQSQSTQAIACLSAVCQHDLPWAVSAELPKCSGIRGGAIPPQQGWLTSWHHAGVLGGALEGLGHTQVGSTDKIILPKTSLFPLSQ